MKRSFFARFAPAIIILVALGFPVAFVGMIAAIESNHNDVKEWLPKEFRETQEYQEFQRHFLSETYVLASWEGCTLGDERQDRFAELIAAAVEQPVADEAADESQATGGDSAGTEPTTIAGESPVAGETARAPGKAGTPAQPKYFKEVLTGRAVLEQLTHAPNNLEQSEAIARLRGTMIGPKVGRDQADDSQQPDERAKLYKEYLGQQYTCVILTLSDEGKAHGSDAVEHIYQTAERCDIPRATMRLGGPPVDNVAIDRESEQMRLKLMFLSAGVGFALAYWYLRNIPLTIMVFIGGVYSAVLSLAMVKALGGTMDTILFTMPSVVYTSGLSAAIHIVNYYRHTRAQEGLAGSPERGLKLAWLPCLLSAGTTSLGLISLVISPLVPIKHFGFYTAVGVMSAVGLMYLYLPAALYLWPPKLPTDHTSPTAAPSPLDMSHRRRMRGIGRMVVAHPLVIWVVFMAVMAVAGSGLRWMKTTIDLMGLFSPDAEIIQSYRWLEEKLGPMVPMEVVVYVDKDKAPRDVFERAQLIERIESRIKDVPHTGGTMSAATFMPDKEKLLKNTKKFLRSPTLTTFERRLKVRRKDYLVDGDVSPTGQDQSRQELWRISFRVAALEQIDYGSFIGDIKDRVEPAVAAEKAKTPGAISGVVYTGLIPVVYRAEREMLNGLEESFFWAFLMMATVMSFVYRDIRAGLYTMLPNVWPVAVVFGLMSWMGIALDIGTMMTASVAMGVCVDDTVHFANWFRRATRAGLNRQDAVVMAYENSAGAIYQSTVIVALGLAVFALSTFMPTHRFGLLMATLLAFGLVADLVLTPAMLSGLIGRYFTRGCHPPGESGSPDEQPEEVSAAANGGSVRSPQMLNRGRPNASRTRQP